MKGKTTMNKLEKVLPIICAILGTVAVYVSLESIVGELGWLDPITLVIGSQFIAMTIRSVFK
tara:strand:+ start:37 stop:222 length:186 start_codon:yes stop_codon:yes gene_type:complete